MSSTIIGLLGGGAGATVLLGAIDRIRNRKYDKQKQKNTLQLDDVTMGEIQTRAEQSQNSSLMAVGAFWSGQFLELSKKVEADQKVNRERWDRLMDRVHLHKVWDATVVQKLHECDMGDIDPPPSLDPDEPIF